MREEFETVLCQTAVVGNAVPLFDKCDSIADSGALVRLFAEDANRDAAASFDIDNRDLIRRIGGELFGRRVNDSLCVDDAVALIRSGSTYAAPRMVTTQVAPDPPRFWAKPTRWRRT